MVETLFNNQSSPRERLTQIFSHLKPHKLYLTITSTGPIAIESEREPCVSIWIASETEVHPRVSLDLSAFIPPGSPPSIWNSLQPAKDVIVELVRAIVGTRPELHLHLERLGVMVEPQAEAFSRQLFNDIINDANGVLHSLRVECPMDWILPWVCAGNPRLREICYTKFSSDTGDVEEFWNIVASRHLRVLALDGFDLAPIERFPVVLTELILTHLDDTVHATNTALTCLPHLKLLSLRLQKKPSERGVSLSESRDKIVCPDLRKVWWTMSNAPFAAVEVVSQICRSLESLSPPRNVTDHDLQVLSSASRFLTQLWMMDCPNVSELGFKAIKHLTQLKHLQVGISLARFLSESMIKLLIEHCSDLNRITIVFDGTADEEMRMNELLAIISGEAGFCALILPAMSFRASNLGDQMTLDVNLVKERLSFQ